MDTVSEFGVRGCYRAHSNVTQNKCARKQVGGWATRVPASFSGEVLELAQGRRNGSPDVGSGREVRVEAQKQGPTYRSSHGRRGLLP